MASGCEGLTHLVRGPSGIAVFDLGGALLGASPRAEELLSLEAGSTAAPVLRLLFEAAKRLSDARSTGEAQVVVELSGGRFRRLGVSLVPSPCPHEHADRLVALLVDAESVAPSDAADAGLRALAAALARAQSELAEAQARGRLGGGVVELRSGALSVSAELAELLRLGALRASSLEALKSLLSADDAQRLAAALARAAAGEASAPAVRVNRLDGTALEAKLWLRPLSENGRVERVALMLQDVSEQTSLMARLHLTERLASMGTLAAGVGHEINNPLAFVIANLNSVRNELGRVAHVPGLDLEDVKDALREAAEGAERVRQVVADLRTLTRNDQNQVGPVDVRRVVQAALNMARNETRHRAQVVMQLNPVDPVRGNEARLGQVFLNLVVNAAQAIPDGKATEHRITVTTAMDGAEVLVSVEDTGRGIAPEVLPRIFDAFFTTKKATGGTGLGLSITQGIVHDLGGELRVRSALGHGTTVEVRLPSASPSDYQARPSPMPKGHQARVLIIDDEPAILRALRRLLAPKHLVTTVGSGREALSQVQRGERFDVIFCDVMMPDMNGIDVWDGMPEEQRAAMIFVTGGTFTERANAFFTEVRPPMLEKPLDVGELEKVIARRLQGLPFRRTP